MSVKVMTWVWEHSQAKGNDRLVLLAIADNANHDGGNAFPGHPELMRKTLLPRSTIYACIDRLIELGELEREVAGGGRGRRTVYRVTMANRPAQGPYPDQETVQQPDGLEAETVQVTHRNSPGSAVAYKEGEPSENRQIPPTVVAPTGASANGHAEVVPLRSQRAVQAANGTLERLKAGLERGERSWSLSDAARDEWLSLLDDDHNLGTAQQFVMFYIAMNAGRDVRSLNRRHWSMAGQKVSRWRALVLYGVDQAITRVDLDQPDERGQVGQPFWNYVEAVCKGVRAEVATGGAS